MNESAQAASAYEPSAVYLQFLEWYRSLIVKNYRGDKLIPLDPFAIAFPRRDVEGYLPRIGDAERIFGHRHSVITGLNGAGKATLCTNSSDIGNPTTLVVNLPDFEADLPLSESGFVENLASRIARCFWNAIHKKDYERCLPERTLAKAGGWEEILGWVYQNYPPETDSWSELKDLDRYLKSWFGHKSVCPPKDPIIGLARLIKGPPIFVSTPPDLKKLRQQMENAFDLEELKTFCTDFGINKEAIGGSTIEVYAREFITYCNNRLRIPELLDQLSKERPEQPWSEFPSASPWPFDGTRLVIDFANSMSTSHQVNLVRAILSLVSDELLVTILAPSSVSFESGIHQLQLFTGFKLNLHRLPTWTEDELQRLVLQRGEKGYVGDPNQLLPTPKEEILKEINKILHPKARALLVEIIARSATRSYSLHDPTDAPIHALHLARLALTTCAERWKTAPPEDDDGRVDEAHLWRLCDRYWSEWRRN